MSKQVLMEIDNVRIIAKDEFNVELQRYEEMDKPTEDKTHKWYCKGFYRSVRKALAAIVNK